MKENAVIISNLSFSYPGRDVLEQISINIPARQFSVFLGRNGSGKSTLLRIMAGLQPYRMGSVRLFNREVKSARARDLAQLSGFLSQHHRPSFPFSVEDVILTGTAAGVNFLPGKKEKQIVEQILEQLGIRDLRTRDYSALSGGEQQMVMIARVLAQQPGMIMLDEPTTHLDLVNQGKLMKLLRTFVSSGLTVICVLHDPNLAFLYADNFFFFKDKKIIQPMPETAPDLAFLRNVYGEEITGIKHGNNLIVLPH